MPINPNIPLQTNASLSQGIGSIANAIQTNKNNEARDRQLNTQEATAAKNAELTDLQIDQIRGEIDSAGKTQSFTDLADDSLQIRNLLTNNDIEGAREFTIDRIQRLNERRKTDPSVNTQQSESFLQALETDPQQALGLVEGEIKNLTQLGFIKPLSSGRAGSVNQANAPVMLENPTTGETILAFPTINKDTKEATLEPAEIPEGFQLVKETPEAKRQADLTASLKETTDKLNAQIESEPKKAAAIAQAKAATEKAEKSFEQIDLIRTNIVNLRSAKQAVLAGAGTGPVDRLLPSFKAASIALDSAQGRLGLDVVGSTTFGALSQGELDLAKAVALPTGLEGPELVKWIDDKINAQDKLSTYLEKQAVFLSGTDERGNPNSVADWKIKEKAELNQILESQEITEEDIKTTMSENDMDRSQVLSELRSRFGQ